MNMFFLKYTVDSDMGNRLEKEFSTNGMYIYNTPNKDQEKVFDAFKNSNTDRITIAILGYNSSLKKISKGWIGKCRLLQDYTLTLQIESARALSDEQLEQFKVLFENSSDNTIKIENVASYLFVKELPKDELFNIIYDLSEYSLSSKKQEQHDQGEYSILGDTKVSKFVKNFETRLHELAQKSIYAKRPLGLLEPNEFRTEFQRDKERIVHSKAFRRLVDKAQVYNTSKGDHYRTRLTHTLEVSQIAIGIARRLKLNEDLVEAIALGHDIGHTPFGHEGERQLDLIMSGKQQLSNKYTAENFGGFKHNFQGIRIANYLEEKYVNHEGLDLTYQVLEGILKHTRIKQCKKQERHCDKCYNKCFDIQEFMIIGDYNELHLDKDFCTSLEGQVVSWADEIAQRGHDIDDGIASGVLTIDELFNEAKNRKKLEPIKKLIEEALKEIEDAEGEGREFIDIKDMQRAIIAPRILGYFINRLIKNSMDNMELYYKRNSDFSLSPYINEEVISFNKEDKDILEELEDIIKLKVINSQEVNCFDGKSAYIIRKLFEAYYANPRQLPNNIIRRINRGLEQLKVQFIDIRTGKKNDVEKEINIYKGLDSSGNDKEDFIKQKIFMRNITDFISGMTDDFASDQYKKLYN